MKTQMENKEQKTYRNGITEGIIWKEILRFFFPILIGTFFQQLYNTIDAIVVGQFAGKEALSSVGGSSAQIINLVVGFFTGLSAGATVIISQHYGSKDREGLDRALHTAYAFASLGGIAFGILGVLFAPKLLVIMNTPTELLVSSILYIRVYFAGLVFIFIYNIGSAILRAIGDSRRPLYYLILCCIINIVLDLLFVLVFHMGVFGVAVATMIAQAVSAFFVTSTLAYHTEGLQLKIRKIRFHKETLQTILLIGLPSGVQSSMYSISNIIVQAALNNLGVDTVAAWAAYGKVDSIFWMINGAFGISITTFVGQNYGAGNWDRIRKGVRQCFLMAFSTALILSFVITRWGGIFLHAFSGDAGVVEVGMRMIRLISPTYALFIFIEILSGALRAEGHVLITTLVTLSGICIFRIIWVTLIVPEGSLEQIISCYPITWGLCATIIIIYYFYKQKKVLKR